MSGLTFAVNGTTYSELPLYFIPNRGQVSEEVVYFAKGFGYTLFVTEEGLVFDFPSGEGKREIYRVTWNGGQKARVRGFEETDYHVSFFLGSDAESWQQGLETYSRVRIEDQALGYHLDLTGREGELKIQMIPGEMFAGSDLVFRYERPDGKEMDRLAWIHTVDERGSLPAYMIETDSIREAGLTLRLGITPDYSAFLGGSECEYGETEAKSVVVGDAGNILLTGNTYCSTFPLQDPMQQYSGGGKDVFITKLSSDGRTLLQSTFLGGMSEDQGSSIDVDTSGNIYVVGWTWSEDFPVKNAYQGSLTGADVFVTKISSDGSEIIFSTFFDGVEMAPRPKIAVDGYGSVYLVGSTSPYWGGAAFPIVNAFQDTYGGGYRDAFLTKFTPDGSDLVFSTFLGGSSYDQATSVTVDEYGNAIVAGISESVDFPLSNAYQGFIAGSQDAFVAKFTVDGSALIFSTYLGGSYRDMAYAVAVDGTQSVLIAGLTQSSDFPLQYPYQDFLNGNAQDLFLSKLSSNGMNLLYSTFFGGSGGDYIEDMAVNSLGNIYVAGHTHSVDLPVKNAFQDTPSNWEEAFLAKFDLTNHDLIFSTYLGGSYEDKIYAVDVDSYDRAVVVGFTESYDFPVHNAFQHVKPGEISGFVTKFSPGGSTLIFSTYLGGTRCTNNGYEIKLDGSGSIILAGLTNALDFPIVDGFQESYAGGLNDLFITKFNADVTGLSYSTYLGGSGREDFDVGFDVDGQGNLYVAGTTYSEDYPVYNAFQDTLPGSYSAFLSKMSSDGSSLVYSTFLGGTMYQGFAPCSTGAKVLVVDDAGYAYIAGHTDCDDFPVQNPYQHSLHGWYDAFLTKFSLYGTSLIYSTYLGGSASERLHALAVDDQGYAYVAGETNSPDFPLRNAYQNTIAGDDDIFVTKFAINNTYLVYSTYLGGSDFERPLDIAVDDDGNAYVAGSTRSSDFPLQNPFQASMAGFSEGFITKISQGGTTLDYSTYLGGDDSDSVSSIQIDAFDHAYVAGGTRSTNFPVQAACQESIGGRSDGFLTRLSADGTAIDYSTYLGGSLDDRIGDIVLDSDGIYASGSTQSYDFPIPGSYGEIMPGITNIFVAKFRDCPSYVSELGDVSRNDQISALDASLVLQGVVGLITLDCTQVCLADVNQNDQVSSLDAAYVLMCTVGNCGDLPSPEFQASCSNHGNCI